MKDALTNHAPGVPRLRGVAPEPGWACTRCPTTFDSSSEAKSAIRSAPHSWAVASTKFFANQVSRTDTLAVNFGTAGHNRRVESADFSCSVIHRRGCYWRSLFLGFLSYHTFGRKKKAGDRCRVLKSASHHLGGVDDSGLHQVFELLLCCVESKCALVAPDLIDHHRTVLPGILCDPACWFIKGFPNNVDAEPFLFAGTQLVQRRR